jgi:2-methylcitrate dehydratase PrpD
MTKSFNPGRAGQNGLLAALLASKGFTSSDQMLEAQRGWARTVSPQQKFDEITSDLGTRFEMALNTYKPFACGVVIHPVIDGCIQLRNKHRLTPAEVAKVELRVHPLVLELTGKTSPRDGLEGKFSVYHAAAIALIDGRAGPKQFSDAAVQSPDTIALRQKVTTTIDPAIKESQADVTLVTTKGERLKVFIADALGSVANPLSDQDLEGKATDLMDGILPEAQIRIALRTCWNIATLAEAAALATVLRPPVR